MIMFRLACQQLWPSSKGAAVSISRASSPAISTSALKLWTARPPTTYPFVDETCHSLLAACYRRLPPNMTAVRSFADEAGTRRMSRAEIAQKLREINDEKWEWRFELLCRYQKENGDCLVPKQYTIEQEALGEFVRAQRTQYRKLRKGKKSAITPDRINKLEAIGFDWDPLETQWHSKYELLRRYKKDKGDCLVLYGVQIDDVNLGEWVVTQRKQYRKLREGWPSAMTQDRINKLEAIGFDWDPHESKWHSKFELLCRYKNENGDCLVPARYVIDGVPLGKWVLNQRQEYRKLKEGKPSVMTKERIDKLEALGLEWNPLETEWCFMLELLFEYKQDNGDCLVPRSFAVDRIALGKWVGTQRQEYQKLQDGKPSPMTQERIDKLEALGFVWNTLEAQWNSNFNLLCLYKKDNGDCLVPKSYAVNGVALGQWVLAQRQEYRKLQKGKPSTMTQERIKKLSGVGFVWSAFQEQWKSNFDLLQRYKDDKGDCLVPRNHQIDDVALGEWVHAQRQEYRKLQKGKPSPRTKERIDKLEALGLEWNPLET